MLSTSHPSFTYYPVSVPVPGDLRSINFYLLLVDGDLILFDGGLPDETYWNALVESLHENGFSLGDISAVLLSHHHNDHCGVVNQLTEKEDIPVYAHEKAIPYLQRDEQLLQKRAEFFKKLYQEFDCGEEGEKQVAHLLRSIETNRPFAIEAAIKPIEEFHLPLFQLLHLPGHSPDQVGLWEEETGLLFGADFLIQHISSNALIGPDENGNRLPSLIQNVETLQKVSELPVSCVLSGHGEKIENPTFIIEKRLQGIEKKGDKILRFIEEGAKTGRDIAQSYYKNTYYKQFPLVMSEIIGQLDYLEKQGKITKRMQGGVWVYQPIHA
ncbi:MBL fold metallo-hydrolase [Bacillus piscicola]|uniref:MBL fold metallo-hydrolase n=1 Tax=Bacillus piscicola TaxID=1632684 RepID=UPI001F088D32|nr:MBL fold metallo-hydrolase [Bacillus piscicola]